MPLAGLQISRSFADAASFSPPPLFAIEGRRLPIRTLLFSSKIRRLFSALRDDCSSEYTLPLLRAACCFTAGALAPAACLITPCCFRY
jgi:hypothetical protein